VFATWQVVAGLPAAADGPGGVGFGSRTVCFDTGAGGAAESCLVLHVDGWVTATGAVNGSTRMSRTGAPSHDHIRAFQIDELRVITDQPQRVVGSGGHGQNSGSNRTITLAAGGRDFLVSSCSGYHSVLRYSVRLTDSSLHHGVFTGPRFDSAYGRCAGTLFGPAGRSRICLATVAAQPAGCIEVSTGTVVSNDGSRVYGRGSITVEEETPGADLLGRVQIDNVFLYEGSRATGSRLANSGDDRPRSAEAHTQNGLSRPLVCAGTFDSYSTILRYSVRMADGSVRRGALSSRQLNLPC